MSKKSRQRNKKILAAIGIGLGAAAMASKRKSDLMHQLKMVKVHQLNQHQQVQKN
jgi:hypothetical protein